MGFVLSHSFRKKTRNGWGTAAWRPISEKREEAGPEGRVFLAHFQWVKTHCSLRKSDLQLAY
jgi:hypothetical protein